MAEISVERKPRNPVPLIAGIILVAVLAFVLWRYVGTHRAADASAPAAADSAAR